MKRIRQNSTKKIKQANVMDLYKNNVCTKNITEEQQLQTNIDVISKYNYIVKLYARARKI